MFKQILFGVAGLAASIVSYAQGVPEVLMEEAPAWVEPVGYDAASTQASGGTAHHLVDLQINHSLPRSEYYSHIVLEPLNNQGVDQISELQFRFVPSYQDLILHHVSIIRDGQEIDRRDLSNLKIFQREEEIANKLYSERWDALLILEDLRPRDIVSYSYTVRGSNPIFERDDYGAINLNWGAPIGKVAVTVIADKKLNTRFENGDHPLQVKRVGKNYQHKLTVLDAAAAPNESEYPGWYQPLNMFHYSAYDSWAEVNRWAMQLYELDYSLPSDLLATIDGWLEDYGRDEAINRVLEFVQDDIRYFGVEIGVNSHLPRSPAEILSKRYGDCKDKTVLAKAMLARLGVEAWPALVSSQRGREIINDLPSPFVFDHVISYFELDGKQYWVDVTASAQGSRLQDKGFIDYQHALLVKPGTKALSAMRAPVAGSEVVAFHADLNYRVNAASDLAQLAVDTQYQGLRAEDMRRFLEAVPRASVDASFVNFYSRNYPNIRQAQALQVEDQRADNRLRTRELYDIEKLSKLSAARRIFSVHTAAIPSYLYYPERVDRKTPLALAHPVQLTENLLVDVDGEVLWNDDIEPVSIRSPWFEFERRVERRQNQFNIQYSYRSLQDHVLPQDMPRYMEGLRALDAELVFQFWAKASSKDSGKAKDEMRKLMDSLINKRTGE